MAAVARTGVTHIIDMQIEFDDTPLAYPLGVEVFGTRRMTISRLSLRNYFSEAWTSRECCWRT